MLETNNLIHDDCLNVMKNMKDNCIDLIVTDPPYGINYQNNRRNKSGKVITENGILNDNKDNEQFLLLVLKECFRILKDGRHIYWFGRYDSISKQIPLLENVGFKVKNQLIWVKNNHGTGDLNYSYAPKYECILYAIKVTDKKTVKRKLFKIGDTTRHNDILIFDRINRNKMIHDHQKPTELLSFLIEKSSLENEIVFDPFAGSGSTLYAADNLNRKYIGCEMDTNIYKLIEGTIIMENRFNISKNEQSVGSEFSSLIGKYDYVKMNSDTKTDIDGKIKNTSIELQELRSSFFIKNRKLCIDALSVFYFKGNKRKKVFLTDKDIDIKKMGKLFTLPDDCIYLIHIDKKNCENVNDYKKYLQNDKRIFLPFLSKTLKELLKYKNNVISVNDKSRLRDDWESGYIAIGIDELDNSVLSIDRLKTILN